jgi:hypothetical protein
MRLIKPPKQRMHIHPPAWYWQLHTNRALLHKYMHSPTHSLRLCGAANTKRAGECAFTLCGSLIGRHLIQIQHKLTRVNVRVNVCIFNNNDILSFFEYANIHPNIHPAPFVWRSN